MSSDADNVTFLPKWKHGSTIEEWFFEIAMIARKYPERFAKVAVIYEEKLANGNTVVRTASKGATTNELLGIVEIGKLDIIENSKPPR